MGVMHMDTLCTVSKPNALTYQTAGLTAIASGITVQCDGFRSSDC